MEAPKKGVLRTIIVLLCLFFPLSVLSFALHLLNAPTEENVIDNPNHEFYYQGKLYFYDTNHSLLGTYPCESSMEYCNFASSMIDDNMYALDYYKSDDLAIDVIDSKYAFLVDQQSQNPNPFLYDIQKGRVITKYSSVKNYGIGIEENLFIVGDQELKYGVLSLDREPRIVVDFDYDFLGIANFVNEDENKIMKDLFVGYKNNSWYLLDANGAVLTDAVDKQIVSYNGKHIITKDDQGYYLVNYQNKNQLEEERYVSLSFVGKYINVIDNYNDFYVYDITSKENLIEPIHIRNNDTITSKINDLGKLEIIQNDKVIQVVEIA